ncbi:MAG: OB-fold nucleic acid binding domain-containing protein [Candidatus Aenigmarchaeota archaeon]|nr:OB-fold nucleic acid binding domain-containing protein [Candidatus Aenigmarchaeota archaeon]
MKESTLKAACLASALAGLLLLFLVSSAAVSSRTGIVGITLDHAGRTVKICGSVDSLRISNGHMFFNVDDDSGRLRAVIFNGTAAKLGTSTLAISQPDGNPATCFIGVVSEYPKGSGQVELVVTRIEDI